MEPERIAAVALLYADGQMDFTSPPARHPSLFLKAQANGWSTIGSTQGFATSTGRFVDRKEAWGIAERAGQLLPVDRAGCVPGTLYSEDVW